MNYSSFRLAGGEPLSQISPMQRLGKNIGKYLGESIVINDVIAEMEQLAVAQGWTAENFSQSPDYRLIALKQSVPNARRNLYISTGIHGDEPAGPLALLEIFRQKAFPMDANIWIIPCLNPTGFPHNQRESAAGLDLNREYREPKAGETIAHVAWLATQPRFDMALCLHEDWEANGFYLYELNPDQQPTYAERIVENVAQVCPIDLAAEIEDRPAAGGIIRPALDPTDRPLWPEAFYLITHRTRLSYTLEAPSDFPLATRVAALIAGVQTVLLG